MPVEQLHELEGRGVPHADGGVVGAGEEVAAGGDEGADSLLVWGRRNGGGSTERRGVRGERLWRSRESGEGGGCEFERRRDGGSDQRRRAEGGGVEAPAPVVAITGRDETFETGFSSRRSALKTMRAHQG